MVLLLLETGPGLSGIVLLRPAFLLLALLVVPLLAFGMRRLVGLSRVRRWSALVLESLSALLLVVALTEPALVTANDHLDVVLVLDASRSVSQVGRFQAASYAKEVLAGVKPGDRVRFISTAEKAALLSPEQVTSGDWQGKDKGAAANPAPTGQDSTDLAAGLRLADSLLADSGPRRVVLVSDGWETRGKASDEAARLAARGIDLQVVRLDALGTPEIIAENLIIPPYVRVGDTIAGELTIYSTGTATATLQLDVDGSLLSTRAIALKEGENRVSLEQHAAIEGFHTLNALISSPADTSNENNAASATVIIKPQPSVLMLEDRTAESDALASALANRQVRVDTRSSNEVPSQLGDLDLYDAIVLDNVAATSLTLDQQRTLQEYVRRNGRGLVVVGGPTSFAKGGYPDSVLEEALPLSSQPAPRPQKGSTALILVFDRSGSMDLYNGAEVGVSKLSMAKEAARLAVDALRTGDTLGVLGFDTQNDWIVPVQTITGDADKEKAKQQISGITAGAGTSIYTALDEAATSMRTVQAPNRHMVLLTDGQDYRSPSYEPLLDQLRTDNITLSTIGIGSDADKDLLTRLAKQGQGRYYFTERPQQIPKIVFKELDLTLKEAVVSGQVQPHLLAPSPLLRGFAPQDLPLLGGYNITVAKDDAVVGLTSDQGDPLLAHWNYGLGRVVAFTGDSAPDWASQWLNWGDFARFWNQAVRWTMSSPINRQLQPSVSLSETSVDTNLTGEKSVLVSVESLHPDNTFDDLGNITAALRAPSGAVTTTLLMQTAPGHYEASLPVTETVAY